MPDFIEATYRNAKYLEYIRTLSCTVCKKPSPSEAHHISTGGMALKCSDLETAPLCNTHHMEVTSVNSGKKTFVEKYRIDWIAVRLNCLVGFILKKNSQIEDIREVLLKALETTIKNGEVR